MGTTPRIPMKRGSQSDHHTGSLRVLYSVFRHFPDQRFMLDTWLRMCRENSPCVNAQSASNDAKNL